jgi:hypothetical protein
VRGLFERVGAGLSHAYRSEALSLQQLEGGVKNCSLSSTTVQSDIKNA